MAEETARAPACPVDKRVTATLESRLRAGWTRCDRGHKREATRPHTNTHTHGQPGPTPAGG